ncbi:MAG: O-antigen ligase family protein [Lewinellaceae bacterium]|nr:O-antigen ligase family protein [Saprospiraceae bacterium]MCB9341156.1 O-antigen ligase family protein [Lewinellaceae bacterium]
MRQVIHQKLNNPLGYGMAIFGAVGLSWVLSMLPLKVAMLIVGGMVGIPVVVACFANLFLGINVMLVAGFFLGLAAKYTNAPIGTALDGLMVLMLVGLLVRLIKEKDFSFAKSPISIFILAWIYYNLLEVLNPWAGSKLAWVYTVRTVALLLAIYFVAAYALDSKRRIFTTVKVILGLAFFSALYSLKQEFIGFSNAEITWLHADEERFMLIFQWDRMRVFSLFSDPTTFGILMGYMSVFCLLLASGPFKIWKRIALVISGISMLMGMAYAGSRTPFVMLPMGIVFFMVLTFKRETILACIVFFMLGTVMVLKSTNSAVIWRIQSAFRGESSDTIEVRMKNQERVQPYIHSHPVGAGLGSTGYWGKRFTPDSWLASFAHDSLYVRLAVETGWIGLILYMSLLFVAMKTSIYYYFRVKDPTIKTMYLGFTITVFLLALASYPQEAITLLPTSIVFYVMLAMIVRLKDFDPNFQKIQAL